MCVSLSLSLSVFVFRFAAYFRGHLGSQHGTHETMGAVSSGLTDGFRGNCCVQRRPPVRCFNPHLNLQLLKLEHSGARIEEVWLVRPERGIQAPLSPNLSMEPMESRLAIVYNISEGDASEGSSIKPLRLDWHPDGLAFMRLTSNNSGFYVSIVFGPLHMCTVYQHSLSSFCIYVQKRYSSRLGRALTP